MDISCGNCAFYYEAQCIRYPPVVNNEVRVFKEDDSMYTVVTTRQKFPIVFKDDFCGEFKQKENPGVC